MCTVTYIPLRSGGFVFTSNRDESPKRSPEGISVEMRGGQTILFPKDTVAGGTWIAISDQHRLACVLNGAFVKHQHRPPYRLSRGIMLLKYFESDSVEDFCENFDLEGIEPFTLIVIEGNRLMALRWDEVSLHTEEYQPEIPLIWSSATLYSPEVQHMRKGWFEQWIAAHPYPTPEEILDFHLHGGEADPINGFVMNRGDLVRTVSVTQVVNNSAGTWMEYHDLLRGKVSRKVLTLQKGVRSLSVDR